MKKKQQDYTVIADALKAISHPNRISILILLGRKETKLSVTEICENLKLNQPEASRHLSILKGKGILFSERIGTNIFYFMNRDNIVFDCLNKLKPGK